MEWLLPEDWSQILIPDTPLLEIFVRGTLMYLALFCLLRMILKRQAGSIGMTDLLVLMLIADAAQNGMAGDYRSLPDGILLVATLIFWNYALEWLGYHFPQFEHVIHAPPLPLVKNGRLIQKHMRKELVTEEELMTRLREKGVEHLNQVKQACLEGNGKISIVLKK